MICKIIPWYWFVTWRGRDTSPQLVGTRKGTSPLVSLLLWHKIAVVQCFPLASNAVRQWVSKYLWCLSQHCKGAFRCITCLEDDGILGGMHYNWKDRYLDSIPVWVCPLYGLDWVDRTRNTQIGGPDQAVLYSGVKNRSQVLSTCVTRSASLYKFD